MGISKRYLAAMDTRTGRWPDDDEYAEEVPQFSWREQFAAGGPQPGHPDCAARPTQPLNLPIPTLQAGAFHNLDDVMLHAAFAVLRQFLEEEFPGHIRWRKSDLRELEELYRWWETTWMHQRPGDDEECRKDDEMLLRLMRIRQKLWT